MNAIRHFDEDDLAAYAMGLLAEPEASAVAAHLAANEEARTQLAEIEARLGAFAQAAVELRPIPEGSMERFLAQVAREGKPGSKTVEPALAKPLFAVEATPTKKGFLVPWLGWAVAAALALTAGKLQEDRTKAERDLSARNRELAPEANRGAAKNDTASKREQPKTTGANPDAGSRNDGSDAEIASLREQEARLRRNLAKQTKEIEAAALEVQQQKTLAVDAERERDQVQGSFQAQAKQVEELSRQAKSAREVLDALTDRSAMRVLLTEPKQQPTPTGRATYVASRGTLVFQGSHLAPLESSKVYELWILPADGSKPVPAGTFRPDAQGEATLVSAELPNSVPAKGFGVTVENDGGALSPTMPILLLGTSGA